ncbi:MAG: S8 family serine peptidase [Chitinophagaceae bacterium]|nr:S8 family serine peptidase [Chitinophagaceae bacterium]
MTSTLRRTLLIVLGLAIMLPGFSQKNEVPKGWHLLDYKKDGYQGISLDKAYEFVKSKKLKSTPVIVAVIDSGIDTLHEDLQSVLWRNTKEIPGNGIDDDNNGYIDDVYGWNFLGNSKGQNVEKDSYEAARVYHKLREKWGNTTVAPDSLSAEDAKEYEMFWRAKADALGSIPEGMGDVTQLKLAFDQIKLVEKIIQAGDVAIRAQLSKEEILLC